MSTIKKQHIILYQHMKINIFLISAVLHTP